MYYAILQRWEGEQSDTLCLEYPLDKKDECMRMYSGLVKDAHLQKDRVVYRIVELDGELQYPGKDLQDWRKKNNVNRIIIANGKIHEDIPSFIQKDIERK